MKYPYLTLICAMLLGAGCSLPFTSPPGTQRMPARPGSDSPVPTAPAAAPETSTYTDPEFGVQVSFPKVSATLGILDVKGGPFAAPGISKGLFSITDPANIHIYSPLVLSVWKGNDAVTDCYATSTPLNPLTKTLTINGVDFRTGYWHDAGAGGLWEGFIYRTFRDGVCYDLEYAFETHSDGSPEYEKIRTKVQRDVPQYFEPMVMSIKFTK